MGGWPDGPNTGACRGHIMRARKKRTNDMGMGCDGTEWCMDGCLEGPGGAWGGMSASFALAEVTKGTLAEPEPELQAGCEAAGCAWSR